MELESSAASQKEAFRAPSLKEVNNIAIEMCFDRTMPTHCSIFQFFLYLAVAFIYSKIFTSFSCSGPMKSGGSSVHTTAALLRVADTLNGHS
jgi:hypothetical protein